MLSLLPNEMPEEKKDSLDIWPPERILRSLRAISPRFPLSELEDLAQEIWLECFSQHHYCSRKLILWRFLDHVKRKAVQTTTEEAYAHQRSLFSPPSPTDIETCHELISKAGLSSIESTTLALYFWLSWTLTEISSRLNINASRTLASVLEKLSIEASKGAR